MQQESDVTVSNNHDDGGGFGILGEA